MTHKRTDPQVRTYKHMRSLQREYVVRRLAAGKHLADMLPGVQADIANLRDLTKGQHRLAYVLQDHYDIQTHDCFSVPISQYHFAASSAQGLSFAKQLVLHWSILHQEMAVRRSPCCCCGAHESSGYWECC